MSVERKFTIILADIEKTDEINSIIFKYATFAQKYSSYYYFNLRPMNSEDFNQDITIFQLNGEDESALDKKLNDLMEELSRLDTLYFLLVEETHEVLVAIEHMVIYDIKFDNVKVIKEGTYEKIDMLNHFKNEFGVCKTYNPNFRPLENKPIENTPIEAETVYVFSDSAENLKKMIEIVFEKVNEIDPNLLIEVKDITFD